MRVRGPDKNNVARRKLSARAVCRVAGVPREHNKHLRVIVGVLGEVFGSAVDDAITDACGAVYEAIGA